MKRSFCTAVVFAACTATGPTAPTGNGLGPQCTPDCSRAACGDDGCGGSCGTCSDDTSCTGGVCIAESAPRSWSCDAEWYGAEDGCDCECGAYDPDCVEDVDTVFNCEDFESPVCSPHGTCSGTCDGGDCGGSAPEGWTCDPDYYDADDGCDCECGIADPDCDDPEETVLNCPYDMLNPTCGASGACEPSCSCDGASCGNDGCGHSCGDCGTDEVCYEWECMPRPPDGWSCAPYEFNDGDACSCECGAHDPDCDDPETWVTCAGSDDGESELYCNAADACEPL
jgi:hypothetical protein